MENAVRENVMQALSRLSDWEFYWFVRYADDADVAVRLNKRLELSVRQRQVMSAFTVYLDQPEPKEL